MDDDVRTQVALMIGRQAIDLAEASVDRARLLARLRDAEAEGARLREQALAASWIPAPTSAADPDPEVDDGSQRPQLVHADHPHQPGRGERRAARSRTGPAAG